MHRTQAVVHLALIKQGSRSPIIRIRAWNSLSERYRPNSKPYTAHTHDRPCDRARQSTYPLDLGPPLGGGPVVT
ncbi:hypothetical protein FGO68_gene14861 [Halteria grandinella]|uniref:Uncharacterized protein n=1 Tax=Halteria grandinella TaxID=5974 RepID=A0A8J8P4U9_HALGN|nr:hypothetical protein FGO68_gene14861 [Halteria grandinella]